MKKDVIFGLIAGFVAGAVVTNVGKNAVNKVKSEIDSNLNEMIFTSPDENHFVTLVYGTSETAKGLTHIKIKATAEGKDDSCQLVMLAKKDDRFLRGDWSDNDHFQLLVGSGKRKQCVDVRFDGEEIAATYYLTKTSS